MADVTILHTPYDEKSRTSRTLLRKAASAVTGLGDELLGPIEAAKGGKPFFPFHPALCCSVTHSGVWWMCAVSDTPVGLDLQIHRTSAPLDRLSRRFFHPLEDHYLARRNYGNFYDVWSAKESFVKFTGQGLSQGLSTFSTVSPEGIFPTVEGAELRLLPFDAGYSLCLCAERIGDVRILPL